MNPFLVMDLPANTTDEAVLQRYRELAARYTPERAPARFAEIRKAFEALRTGRDRIAQRLFHFDATGQALTEDLEALPGPRVERRLTPMELAAALRHARFPGAAGRKP